MAAMQEAIQELPMFNTGCTVTTKYGAIVAIHDVTAEMTMHHFMGPKVHQVHLRPATDIAYQQLVRERKELDNGNSMKALVAARNLRKGDNSSECVADLIGMLRMWSVERSTGCIRWVRELLLRRTRDDGQGAFALGRFLLCRCWRFG